MFVSLLLNLALALTASVGTAEPSTLFSLHSLPSQLAICLEEKKLVDIHPHNSLRLPSAWFPSEKAKKDTFFPHGMPANTSAAMQIFPFLFFLKLLQASCSQTTTQPREKPAQWWETLFFFLPINKS